MKKYIVPIIAIISCLCITIGYVAHLHRNYEAQKVAWNTIVQETFHEALLVEVNRMHKMETGWYIGFAGFGCIGSGKRLVGTN